MNTEGSFIHIADVGKLYQSACDLNHFLARRSSSMGVYLQPVPVEPCSLTDFFVGQDTNELVKFAKTNNIPETTLNAAQALLFRAANEHEEINKALRDIMTRVILYYGENIQVTKDHLKSQLDIKNTYRDTVIAQNDRTITKSEHATSSYSKRVKETSELMEIRKHKLIRSMNKALERAGGVDGLSENDRKVFVVMMNYDWVGFDGSIHCCKEQNILGANALESKSIVSKILQTLK